MNSSPTAGLGLTELLEESLKIINSGLTKLVTSEQSAVDLLAQQLLDPARCCCAASTRLRH